MADKIVHVEPQDETKKNSPIVKEGDTVDPSANAVCYWNGIAYSTGAQVCMSGVQYTCGNDGSWIHGWGC